MIYESQMSNDSGDISRKTQRRVEGPQHL